MYVFGKRVPKIVSVREEANEYLVRYEPNHKAGVYDWQCFTKTLLELEEEINDAIQQLKWIAEGNEFPT